jgi:hypothetical protein
LHVITSDVASSWGWLPDFLILDEVCNWQDRGLFDSLLSSAAKRAHCLLVTITNAGVRDSWQHEVREAVRAEGWYFSALPEPVASWIGPDRLREQRRILPDGVFRRIWLNEWVDAEGSGAFDEADVMACCTLKGPLDAREPGWNYVAALDIATRKDTTAGVVVGRHCGYRERIELDKVKPMGLLDEILHDLGHRDERLPEVKTRLVDGSGRLKLANCRAWKAKRMTFKAVKEWVLDQHDRFRLRAVAFDPYASEHLGEELRDEGLNVIMRDQTGGALQEQAADLFDAIKQRRIELYPDADLVADLKRARALERSYGWRLWWPRRSDEGKGTGHGDLGTALSIAVSVSKKFKTRPGPPRVDRPLICA